MTDDTTQHDDDADVEQYENDLYAGKFAEDAEDSGTLVVIADTGKDARNHVVAAAGETVAELNPSYPEDDDVLFCAYRNALDSSFGEAWRNWTPEYLAFEVGDKGVPVYSFPSSRLQRKPDEFDGEDFPQSGEDADEGDADDE